MREISQISLVDEIIDLRHAWRDQVDLVPLEQIHAARSTPSFCAFVGSPRLVELEEKHNMVTR